MKMSKKMLIIVAVCVIVALGAGIGIYSGLNHSKTEVAEIVSLVDETVPAVDSVGETKIEDETVALEVNVEESETVAEEIEEEIIEEGYVKTSGKLENGDFENGIQAFEVYAMYEDSIEYTADSTNGFQIEIGDTGTEDWHVQLKQAGIKLEKGKWYRLTLDAKSSISRNIVCTMQRNGLYDDNWTPYSASTTLALGKNWKTYTILFKMDSKTDFDSIFNLSMGTINGKRITKSHSVSIHHIKLEQLADDWTSSLRVGDNLIANTGFDYDGMLWEASVVSPASCNASFVNGQAVFDIKNPGTVDWHVQLKQQEINLKKDQGYRLTFKVDSTVARTIKVGFMDTEYVDWYGGADVELKAGMNEITVDFKNEIRDNPNAIMMISMGKIEGVNTPAGTLSLSDFMLVPADVTVVSGGGKGPITELLYTWFVYDHLSEHTTGSYVEADGSFRIDIKDTGTENWHVQLQNKGVSLEKGKYYKVSFDAKSTISRDIVTMVQRDGNDDDVWTPYFNATNVFLAANADYTHFEAVFKMSEPSDSKAIFNVCMGTITGRITTPHSIWIKNLKLEETEAPKKPAHPAVAVGGEALLNTSFANDGSGWVTNLLGDASVSYANGSAIFDIRNPGDQDWSVQLIQKDVLLEEGYKYVVSFDASSTVTRDIKLGVMQDETYEWYGGGDYTITPSGTHCTAEFVMPKTITDGIFTISLGKVGNTPASKVTISNVSMIKKEVEESRGLVIKKTDPKNTDNDSEKWVLNLDPVDFNSNVKTGDNITVKVTTSSEGAYSAMLGCCFTSETNEWDWVDTGVQEISNGEYTFVLPVHNYRGALQLQVYSMEADEVVIKSVEVIDSIEEDAPYPSGLVINKTDKRTVDGDGDRWKLELNAQSYNSNVKEGDDLKITVVTSSEGAYEASLGACRTDSWAWVDTGYVSVANGEHTFVLDVESYKGALQLQITSMEADKVVIKSIDIEIIGEEETPETPENPEPSGNELLNNPSFANNAAGWDVTIADWDENLAKATASFENGTAVFNITKPGTEDWHVQLSQYNLTFENGAKYRMKFRASSSVERTIKVGFLSENYAWYGGAEPVISPEEQDVVFEFVVDKETITNGHLSISMGYLGEGTPASVISISNVSFEKVIEEQPAPTPVTPEIINILTNAGFENNAEDWVVTIATWEGVDAAASFANGEAVFDITNPGSEDWHVQIKQNDLVFEQGFIYRVSFVAKSSVERVIKVAIMDSNYHWFGGSDCLLTVSENGPDEVECSAEFTMTGETITNGVLAVSMGQIGDTPTPGSEITITDMCMEKIEANQTPAPQAEVYIAEEVIENQTEEVVSEETVEEQPEETPVETETTVTEE